MKKIFFLAAVAMMMTGCSSDNEQYLTENTVTTAPEPQEVVLTFSPYQMEAMAPAARRAATSIATVVTRLDVWIYESGAEVTAVHQSSSDDDFGTIAVTLDKTKTYTLYAMGHRASGAATLEDGVIAFPDDKVTQSMYYSTTFSPGTTASLSCLMTRIVAQFRFETTDAVPDDVTKMRFTVNGIYDRWNVTTGGTHQLNRVSTINIGSKNADGSASFSVYAITTGAQTLHDVTVEALNEGDETVQSRVFADVPLRNGYRTTYRGVYYTNTATNAAFTVDDWTEYDTVEF